MMLNIYTNLACIICLLQILHLQAQPNSESDTYLLLANRPFVQKINLNGSGLQSIFQDNDSSIVGLDADVRMGKVFWSDTIKKTVVRANLDGSGSQPILNTDIGKIEGLAWDWINKKLYWTDEEKQTIEVMDPATGERKVLAQYSDATKPRAIVVDPERGWLYWSDWNRLTAKIVRMSMDGTTSTILFDNRTVVWPNGLTLDYETETLYWTDAFRDYIGKSKTDGSDFVVVQNLTNSTIQSVHAFAINFHDGHLFWTDWLTDSLFKLRDGAPQGSVELVNKLGNDPCEIHIISNRRQPIPVRPNPCDVNNGGCSHLCLLSATQSSHYSCVCPDGIDESLCNNGTEGTKTTASTTPTILKVCTEFPCLNGGTCYQLSNSFVCQCRDGFGGNNCGTISAGGLENQFSVSGTVFLGVVGALLGVILIMTLIIVVIVLVSMRFKYGSSKGRNHSVVGLTDNSPCDSPTHVVVGRLSDHDYISIKSRESPAPRGIVINIENLGGGCGGRSSPNQYTIHKGIRSSVASNLSIQNGIRPPSGDSGTHLTNGTTVNGLLDMMSRNTTDSDNDSELNILQSRHEHEGNHSHDGVSMV